jgi:glycosyltransferase involved in cell wall biosynthesis
VFLPYLTNDPFARKPVEDASHSHGEKLRFGFMGRLIREKGIERILSLSKFAQLEDIVWHVHGEGPHYPPEYFAGNPRIAYFGRYRGLDELAAILQGLDAVVLFSTHNEGMPLALIEAMAGGLPWLATDRGGTRELAALAENSHVVPVDISDDALADAVSALAGRIRKNETSRLRQRACYEQNFSPERVMQQWENFFSFGNCQGDEIG